MDPSPLNAAAMLRHLADQLDDAGPIAACVVVVLKGDGAWSAMTGKGMSPLVGVSLMEFAKVDLIEGGERWTEFSPNE